MNNSSFSGEISNNRFFDGITVGTTDYQKGIINDSLHFHDNPTLCFLLNGGGIEKKNQKSYERYACDLRFYHGEELHQSVIKVFPSKCVNLDLSEQFLKQYQISETILEMAVAQNPETKFLMLKIHNELLINDAFTNSSIKILFFSLLEAAKNSSRKKPDWVKNLDEILHDNWMENLTLEDLSSTINVHPVTISKHFTKYFSCTLGEYMRKIKINKSLFLIRNSKLSLTEIALQCGFADQSHFIRNFKKFVGCLPKNFKQM